jgi:hypothetical protein
MTSVPPARRAPALQPRPLAETGRRLEETAPDHGFGIGRPAGDGWFGLDEVVTAGVLDRMAAHLLAREGRLDVTGSYLGSHVTGPVVARTVAAVVLDARCPDPDPANVAVHLHPDAWFDELSFRTTAVVVVAGDPAATADAAAADVEAVVVADRAALRRWWAGRLVASVGPLLDAVRTRFPYGRRGLWGAAADRVAAAALSAARGAGRQGELAWGEASLLLDALAEHAPVPLTRPVPVAVRSAQGREAVFPVRGTCCLYYLTVDRPDPCDDGYCTTCPFTDPDHRHRKLAAWLDEHDLGR